MSAGRPPLRFAGGPYDGRPQAPLLAPDAAGLARPLSELPGVRPVLARRLAGFGLETVGDLLTHYPRRYEDFTDRKPIADLKVGDQITFREARQSDGSYKITAIQVVLPTASGTVTAVTSDSVTITQSGGTTEKLTLTSSTSYSEAGATVSASSLVVGARISAKGTVDSAGNFTATAVTIAPATVQGKVASKTSTTILVTTTAGKTVTVDVSSATKYSVSGVSAATLDNVAVGYRISATGTLDSSGTLHATAVQASPAGQPGFGGGGGGFGRGHGFGGGYGRPSPGPSAAASGSNT